MAQTQVRLLPGAAPSPTGCAASPVVGGGTFAAGSYFWKVTFVTDWGETEASNEGTCTVALNGSATISWTVPASGPPIRAVNIYRGTTTGNENTLAGTVQATAQPSYMVPSSAVDTGGAGTAQTPPPLTTFTNVALTSQGEVADADAVLSGLPSDQLLTALMAANQWQNSGGTSAEAQATANAIGVALNWA